MWCTSNINSSRKRRANKFHSTSNGSEQRASLKIIESVSQERALVRQETQDLLDNYHKSEQPALLRKEESESTTFQLSEVRKTSGTASHQIAAESGRAMLEGRAILRKYEEE